MCAIADHDLSGKPLYRFEPYSVAIGSKGVQQSKSAQAAALFMQAAIAVSTQTKRDPASGYGLAAQPLAEARERFDAALLKYWPEETLNDAKTPVGKLVTLSKRLTGMASNRADSQKLVLGKDHFTDRHQRDGFRTSLQQSCSRYAEIVFALDETIGTLAVDWQILSDKFVPLTLAASGSSPATAAKGSSPNEVPRKDGNNWDTFEGPELKNAFEVGVRGVVSDAGIEFTAVRWAWTLTGDESSIIQAPGGSRVRRGCRRRRLLRRLSRYWRFQPALGRKLQQEQLSVH